MDSINSDAARRLSLSSLCNSWWVFWNMLGGGAWDVDLEVGKILNAKFHYIVIILFPSWVYRMTFVLLGHCLSVGMLKAGGGCASTLGNGSKNMEYLQLLLSSTMQNWYDKQQLWRSHVVCLVCWQEGSERQDLSTQCLWVFEPSEISLRMPKCRLQWDI